MEYFKLNEKENFLKNLEKPYDSDNLGTRWYFDTRTKLQHLITLIEAKLNISLINNYNEKPNGMAGQGKGFKLKHYVLTGFIDEKYVKKINKDCFVKIQFCEKDGELIFNTDVDVNFSDPKNKHTSNRDSIQNNTMQSWKVDDSFPDSWDDLIDLILPSVQKNLEYLEKYIIEEEISTSDIITKKEIISKTMNLPLNQILYGPPGTGKTYKTINKAISIINPTFNLNQERNLIKDEYERLVLNNQISFSTFHQSMSYEDFIEGIKPVKPEEEDKFIKYQVESGIFTIACANAAYLCYKKFKELNKKQYEYSFDELHDAFIDHVQKLIEDKNPPVYKTLKGKEITIIKITSTNSIKARALNSTAKRNPAPLTKENLEKLYDKFDSIDEIKTLKQVEETVEVTPRMTEFYAVFKALKEFEKNDFKPDVIYNEELSHIESIDVDEKVIKFKAGVYTNAIKKYSKDIEPVVLIIDEINRGNVSQIFGELITLIEEDKRLGRDEALEVTLPYSKKKFGVPPNLYIIGTMNTADRSVEALDTALRRRFSFEEMPPRFDLDGLKYKISDYDAFAILQTINTRIEKLIDKDHAIGHSYFLNKNSESIVDSFYKNIIPLLQEYFFGDYGKMGMVLGKGFVRLKENEKGASVFADFDTQTAQDFDDREVYEIIDYRVPTDYILKINKTELKMDFNKAIQVLMNKKFE